MIVAAGQLRSRERGNQIQIQLDTTVYQGPDQIDLEILFDRYSLQARVWPAPLFLHPLLVTLAARVPKVYEFMEKTFERFEAGLNRVGSFLHRLR